MSGKSKFLQGKRFHVGFLLFLFSLLIGPEARAIEPCGCLNVCIYQSENYYIFESGGSGQFKIVWDGETVASQAQISNVDNHQRPYWEIGVYRYTRGVQRISTANVKEWEVCKTDLNVAPKPPEPPNECFYQFPGSPNFYIDDFDEEDQCVAQPEAYNIVWNGVKILDLVPVPQSETGQCGAYECGKDYYDRPYWEVGGFRYTRANLKLTSDYGFTCEVTDWEICRTREDIVALYTLPRPYLTMPLSSATGTYTINWGTWHQGGINYTVHESTDPNFTEYQTISNTNQTSAVISDRANGTYYYRVRAENAGVVSEWAYNSCTVSRWNGWWSGSYTNQLTRTDFPTQRPITISVFYQAGDPWVRTISGASYYEGVEEEWELNINGSSFYFDDSNQFNRIEIHY